jgi:hypothetical protein
VLRKLATSAKPKVTLVPNKDGTYSFCASSGLIKTNMIFRPGVDFDEQSMLREKCRSVIYFQGNTMTHLQRGSIEEEIFNASSTT